VASQRFQLYAHRALAEEDALQVVEEVAPRTDTKEVEQHEHGPKAERGGHDEILRFGDDLSGCVPERLHAEAVGVIDEEEFNPARPEEQSAEESEKCLACVAAHEDASHGHRQSHGAHRKGSVVEPRRL